MLLPLIYLRILQGASLLLPSANWVLYFPFFHFFIFLKLTEFFFFEENEKEEEAEKGCKCSICQESPSAPFSSRCGHICCFTCWTDWLKVQLTCPVCRSRVREKQLTKLFFS